MDGTSLTLKVKEMALAYGMDYAGIAGVDRFDQGPQDRHPQYLLPGARAVISMGKKLSKGTLISHSNAYHRGLRHSFFTYLWAGYGLINQHFSDEIALRVTRFLEAEGHVTLPMVASAVEDLDIPMGAISHRHAAVAAGLGEFGWSALFMTPDAGPRVRLVTVITTADLVPDPLYEGPPICDKETCAQIYGDGKRPRCVIACTMHVLSPTLSCECTIGHKTFRYAKFDKFKSMWAGLGLNRSAMGTKDIPVPASPRTEDVVRAMPQRDAAQSLELLVAGRSNYCGRCLNECPVGMPEEVLASRALT